MENPIERICLEFFKNLKCRISKEGEAYLIENVPRSFEDILGKASPYKICFSKPISGAEYVVRGSPIVLAMTKYLEGASKTTLLRIEFNIDPLQEISKAVSLKNCELGNIVRRDSNKFFSRFTFLTTFRYLNESEQVVNEVYVHEGKVVKGDLSGYKVIEGDKKYVSGVHVDGDYSVVRGYLRELLKDKTSEVGSVLGEKLESEIKRINVHYDQLIGELGGDINSQLKRIKEAESQLRVAEGEEAKALRNKLEKIRKGLLKVGDDEAKACILKEQEFTIKDAQHKHSLNIDNKLINTTVIYYPVYSFNLFLKREKSGRNLEVVYDPLTKELGKISCESCGKEISRLNLCSSGHVCCENCLTKCGECWALVCDRCLKKSCSVCGKVLCKSCVKLCMGCGKQNCSTHLRRDSVTGEERCVNCLRACLRCHGLSEAKHFGVALDGSKVCQKCLGEERRDKVMKRIFSD